MPTSNHKEKGSAREFGAEAGDSSLGSQALETTKRMGAYMENSADRATRAMGSGMESIGSAIHEHEPEHGLLHNAGEAIAERLEDGGRYLQTHGMTGMGEDLTNLIRRNPVPALLIGLGIGLLLARLTQKS